MDKTDLRLIIRSSIIINALLRISLDVLCYYNHSHSLLQKCIVAHALSQYLRLNALWKRSNLIWRNSGFAKRQRRCRRSIDQMRIKTPAIQKYFLSYSLTINLKSSILRYNLKFIFMVCIIQHFQKINLVWLVDLSFMR